jgi:hypothetical protein
MKMRTTLSDEEKKCEKQTKTKVKQGETNKGHAEKRKKRRQRGGRQR